MTIENTFNLIHTEFCMRSYVVRCDVAIEVCLKKGFFILSNNFGQGLAFVLWRWLLHLNSTALRTLSSAERRCQCLGRASSLDGRGEFDNNLLPVRGRDRTISSRSSFFPAIQSMQSRTSLRYSVRNTCIGETEAARLAGRKQARIAAASRMAETEMNAAKSSAWTPKSRLCIARPTK